MTLSKREKSIILRYRFRLIIRSYKLQLGENLLEISPNSDNLERIASLRHKSHVKV